MAKNQSFQSWRVRGIPLSRHHISPRPRRKQHKTGQNATECYFVGPVSKCNSRYRGDLPRNQTMVSLQFSRPFCTGRRWTLNDAHSWPFSVLRWQCARNRRTPSRRPACAPSGYSWGWRTMRRLKLASKPLSKASQKRAGSSVKTSASSIDTLQAMLNACLVFSKELVALHPDVIIGQSTPVVAALLQGYPDNSDRIRRRRRSGR